MCAERSEIAGGGRQASGRGRASARRCFSRSPATVPYAAELSPSRRAILSASTPSPESTVGSSLALYALGAELRAGGESYLDRAFLRRPVRPMHAAQPCAAPSGPTRIEGQAY